MVWKTMDGYTVWFNMPPLWNSMKCTFLVIMNKMGKITTVIYKLFTASLGMWVMATFLKSSGGSSVNPRSACCPASLKNIGQQVPRLRTEISRIFVSIIKFSKKKCQDVLPTQELVLKP